MEHLHQEQWRMKIKFPILTLDETRSKFFPTWSGKFLSSSKLKPGRRVYHPVELCSTGISLAFRGAFSIPTAIYNEVIGNKIRITLTDEEPILRSPDSADYIRIYLHRDPERGVRWSPNGEYWNETGYPVYASFESFLKHKKVRLPKTRKIFYLTAETVLPTKKL